MPADQDIFTRQIAHIGPDKHKRIRESTVLVAGVGAIGCCVSEILVRCGVGRLIIIDNGLVDPPDLSRQSLYTIDDVGLPKTEVAARKLLAITGENHIIPVHEPIENVNFRSFFKENDCIIDCLDNFQARFCLERNQPIKKVIVHIALRAGFGHVGTFVKGRTVSLCNLYANVSQPRSPVPVSAPLVYCLSSIAAQEALNVLWGRPLLLGKLRMVHMDGLSFHEQELEFA